MTTAAPAWRRYLADPARICRRTLTTTLRHVPRPPWLTRAELSVLLADDATVRRLNADYRGKDRATNVLSFPSFEHVLARDPASLPPGPVPLGDIVLAVETVQVEAASEGKPFAHHLSHLLVHGCLHLLGYDHQTAEAAACMEQLERDVLAQLGVPDPYAGDAGEPVAEAAGELSLEIGR